MNDIDFILNRTKSWLVNTEDFNLSIIPRKNNWKNSVKISLLYVSKVKFDVHLYETIKLFGIGGAAGNIMNHIVKNTDLNQKLDIVAIDSNPSSLANNLTNKEMRIDLFETYPHYNMDQIKMENTLGKLFTAFENTKFALCVVGLGGITGTEIAPILYKLARQQGIMTIAIVITPFLFEGDYKSIYAEQGLNRLISQSDIVIPISNERLLHQLPEKNLLAVFSMINEFIQDLVDNLLAEMIFLSEQDKARHILRVINETIQHSAFSEYMQDSVITEHREKLQHLKENDVLY